MPTVRVVQFSDTHLGAARASGAVSPEDGLAATVRAVQPLRPDLVLLTGDITDAGQPDEYRRVAELLEPIRAPVLAVAGNHDLPQPLRARFGAESELTIDAWRILMVETYVEGEIHGAIDVDGVIRRLGRDEGRPTLVAMHHPPISPSSKPWFELLGGADLVAALAARTDVRLVVGGHLHDVFRMTCGGVTYLGCPSTWYSLDHVGDEYRVDDGEVGALRIDLFPDGRFDVAVVPRASADVGRAAPTPGSRRAASPTADPAAEGRLFDRYVMLHWTAASQPTRGDLTIWRATAHAPGRVDCVNHATRFDAIAALVQSLLSTPDERVLIGVDFPLGFPHGFAGRIAKGDANWRAVWAAITDEVTDSPTNTNNRFVAADRLNVRAGMSPGPFWGCPPEHASGSLTPERPSTFFGLREHRISERRLHAAGHRVPSAWQLAGEGAAGSEALLGIPMVRGLADHPTLGRRIRVWPFDTGSVDVPTRGAAGAVVIAQVWPGLFPIDTNAHSVREVAVVSGACDHLARLDAAGGLGAMFRPVLAVDEALVVEREEGWILGS